MTGMQTAFWEILLCDKEDAKCEWNVMPSSFLEEANWLQHSP